jgi:hypothetical protein
MRANLEVDHFCGFEGSLILELKLAIPGLSQPNFHVIST